MPTSHCLKIATWNVEGISESKIMQLVMVMQGRSIHILCLQETREIDSNYRYTDGGYLFINSGETGVSRSFAGVGFLLSPVARKSLISFRQLSGRIATRKLKTSGGTLSLVNVYAPHGGYQVERRTQFFDELDKAVADSRTYGMQLLTGDFTWRIHRKFGGEEAILGNNCFGNPHYQPETRSIRELLLQMCRSHELVVANTMCESSVEKLVTYYEIGHAPMDPTSPTAFAQLDSYFYAPICLIAYSRLAPADTRRWRHITFSWRALSTCAFQKFRLRTNRRGAIYRPCKTSHCGIVLCRRLTLLP